MDTHTILRADGDDRRYLLHMLISGSVSGLFYFIGFFMLYAFYHNGQRAKRLAGNPFYNGPEGYEYSVLIVAIIVLVIAYFVGCYFLKSATLLAKAKKTNMVVTSENIYGMANGVSFEVKMADLVFVEVKDYSLKTYTGGMPRVLRSSFFMKIFAETSKYLVMQTKNGDIYYVDAISSIEHAESVIKAAMLACSRE